MRYYIMLSLGYWKVFVHLGVADQPRKWVLPIEFIKPWLPLNNTNQQNAEDQRAQLDNGQQKSRQYVHLQINS